MAAKRAVNVKTVSDELQKPNATLLKKYKVTLLVKDGMIVTSKSKIINVEYNKNYEKDLLNLSAYFSAIFGNAVYDENNKEIIVIGKTENIKVKLKQKKAVSGSGGRINTKIQEKGTTIVLNQVLKNNKEFNKKEDILADKDTADELKKLFGTKYADRLEEWTHSYFEQQKEFLKKFQSAKWDTFTYGKDDFVNFFKKQIKKVARSFDPLKPVGKYETWSPSDIWAVYDMNAVKQEIKKQITPKTQSLVELNNLLINLFKEEKLVGLSLKKIDANQAATLKFVNIDTSTMRLGDIEEYDMSDIFFDFDNISVGDKVTTYIKFGKNGEYSINITRAGQNLSFNTFIKATPAAQGGQAPVKMVEKLLRRRSSNITFTNNHNKYPQTVQEFVNDSKKYSEMYNYLKDKRYFNNSYSFSDFKDNLYTVYAKDKRNAIVKLMTLNFFYDSLKSKSNDSEFWTDILYLGMKVGDKFSPHAKIS